MNPPLFQLEKQSIGYGAQTVLEAVVLEIYPGERVALIGPSGSGKTTLLKRLYSQQAHQTALVAQQSGLVPALSLFHNIYMGRLQVNSLWSNLVNLIYPQPQPRKQIQALAQQLGIATQLWHSVDRLSGGQQQRTSVGRALYRDCPIFIGDEPVSSIDPVQAEEILQLIIKQHPTCIMALHDRHLALKHFDRIIGLKQGRIVLDSATAALQLNELDRIYR